MDKMREEFEAWFFGEFKYRPLSREDGSYITVSARSSWLGWQASRAYVCVQMPRCWNDEQRDYRDNMLDSLDDAGVRHE